MLNLEAIERRYLAGSPAKEDIPDLIAEVRRLQSQPRSGCDATLDNVRKAREAVKESSDASELGPE